VGKGPTFGDILRHKLNNFTVQGRLLNTFEALNFETKYNQTPLIIEKRKTDYGWFFALTLPAGISAKDVEGKLNYFEEQTGGTIELRHKGKTIWMDVCTYEHPDKIPFAFNPADHGKMFAPLPIGHNAKGKTVVIDLGDGIYHILCVGTVGGGKSNIIHQWAWSSIQAGYATFIINTAKREHDYLKNHAIVAQDKVTARKLLQQLNEEMDRRQLELEKYEAVKIQEYPHPENMPVICVILDELADFQDQEGIEALHRLLFLGRSSGLFVLAATQRSSSKLFKSESFTEMRHLFNGRLCFKVNDRFTSDMALGNDLACNLPTKADGTPVAGLAVWQHGASQIVKTMFFDIKQARREVANLPQSKGVINIERPEFKRA